MIGARRETTWAVPLSDVRLPSDAVAAATDTLASGWLSSGPMVERFERAFADYVGTRHAVACSSGTAALQLAYSAIGVRPGDEVIMAALNFVAAANVAVFAGARPVLGDIAGEDDLTVDPDSVAALIGPRTRAVVAMHYGGHPCSVGLAEVARAAGVPLIEDASHAPGAEAGGRRCGTHGIAGCFSFFANKNLPLGEGGMLTTDDDEVADHVRLVRSHGMTAPTWTRHSGGVRSYDVVTAGLNLRLDEPRAAMGVVMLGSLDAENSRRREHLADYRRRLERLPGVQMPFAHRPADETRAAHLCVVLLPPGTNRDAVRDSMADAGVQTSVHYPPISSLSAHADAGAELPRTDVVAPRLLTLPLYGHMTGKQVELVVDQLERALATAER